MVNKKIVSYLLVNARSWMVAMNKYGRINAWKREMRNTLIMCLHIFNIWLLDVFEECLEKLFRVLKSVCYSYTNNNKLCKLQHYHVGIGGKMHIRIIISYGLILHHNVGNRFCNFVGHNSKDLLTIGNMETKMCVILESLISTILCIEVHSISLIIAKFCSYQRWYPWYMWLFEKYQ